MSFFVQSARLFEIVQQTLQAFYSEDSLNTALGPLDDFTGYTMVFDIDAQLSRWLAMVPTHLQLDQTRTISADDARSDGNLNTHTLRRQAIVLRIRFLLARIYVFKPILSRTCMAVRSSLANRFDDETAASPFAYANARQVESLGRRTAFQCSLLCVQTAIEMIHTIGSHQTTAAAWGLKPSWLYGALHVYLGATVLLAARLAPAVLLGEISQDQIQDAWHRALDILGRFQADNVSANRCVMALVILYRKLPGGTPQFGGQRPAQADHSTHVNADDHLQTDEVPSTLGPGSWGLPADMDLDQDFNLEWMPDLQLTDPYDMTWFQATAPDFGLTQN
ncbi:hypothetical protein F5X68DRAFT_257206 [Plectosphaerella plurivora]|uniref:Uncharacterized protein n=1 Tax=Plectosphaerella plurivora TaxID=936078 RepID=A0A9P8VKH7_9PEZI|nr:hypothetical protein F5X68DRAFT_257206 [Plectosphaerella plurivora]